MNYLSEIKTVHVDLAIKFILANTLVVEMLSRSGNCVGQHQKHYDNVETC